MKNENLIRTLPLDNGLKLNLFDCSRRIAGDRWYVELVARIDIDIEPEMMEKVTEPDITEIQNALGKTITFEQKRERNFIADDLKDQVWAQIADSFLESSLYYLSRPSFPGRYILKAYREWVNQRKWRTPGE